MEYVDFGAPIKAEPGTVGKILCCECGLLIDPNPANMCVNCLRNRVDITQGIQKEVLLNFCPGCSRYLQPPEQWVSCEPQSKELLTVCLKKLNGLKEVKIIDATFIWTEPHSKRIKLQVTVQAEVMGGAVLQQVFVVEFIVNSRMCDDCHRVEAQNYWRCSVQLRQDIENKKTLYYIEQLILKHKMHENTVGIEPKHGGLDFFFLNESQALKLIDFIQSAVPLTKKCSKNLISHDIHSNTYNAKISYSLQVVPLAKGSLVCLDKTWRRKLGGISPICNIARVTASIHLIDPCTAQTAEVENKVYQRAPFRAICHPNQLVEFIVMDIEIIQSHEQKTFPGQGPVSHKHVLADVWLVKASELGIADSNIHTRTHLGHLLKPGDSVMCYNLAEANINNDTFDELARNNQIPDVVIMRKHYGDRARRRRWELNHLPAEITNLDTEREDYKHFLEDLDDDPELRQKINIYKKKAKNEPEDYENNTEDWDGTGVTLAEMMDCLDLDDQEMAE